MHCGSFCFCVIKVDAPFRADSAALLRATCRIDSWLCWDEHQLQLIVDPAAVERIETIEAGVYASYPNEFPVSLTSAAASSGVASGSGTNIADLDDSTDLATLPQCPSASSSSKDEARESARKLIESIQASNAARKKTGKVQPPPPRKPGKILVKQRDVPAEAPPAPPPKKALQHRPATSSAYVDFSYIFIQKMGSTLSHSVICFVFEMCEVQILLQQLQRTPDSDLRQQAISDISPDVLHLLRYTIQNTTEGKHKYRRKHV